MSQKEFIKFVEIEQQELYLFIENSDPSYQYIYREASAVYWDDKLKAFKSAGAPGDWPYIKWFQHIVDIVKNCLDIELVISTDTKWLNITPELQAQIINLY